MEGFKTIPKMQHFKEGGTVKAFTKRDRKETDAADIAQDKKIVKKAMAIHDKQEHSGEKTDLSKLRKGGRAKKAVGTVNKYKAGGNVTNVYEAKKKAGDLDAIEKVKDIKAGKADASSKAAVILKNTPAKFCGGKSVKKMKAGKLTGKLTMKELEEQRAIEKMARAQKYLGKGQQGELISQSPAAAGLTPPAAAPAAPVAAPSGAVPAPMPNPGINAGAGAPAAGAQNPPVPGGMKKGGKAKGKC